MVFTAFGMLQQIANIVTLRYVMRHGACACRIVEAFLGVRVLSLRAWPRNLTVIASVHNQGALVERPKVLEALPLQAGICGSFHSGDSAIFT